MRGLFSRILCGIMLLASAPAPASSWVKSCENPLASDSLKNTYKALAKFAQIEWAPNAKSCRALDKELSKVKVIDLRDEQLQDLTPVFGLTALTQLLASGNAISSLEGIEALKNLELLDLGNNAIENLKPLAGLPKLTQLRLAKNNIKDIQVLVHMTQLEKLSLAYNKVQSIEGLDALKKLNYLSIASNEISRIAPAKTLNQLMVLNLSFNQICGADDLTGFPNKDTKVVGREFQTCKTSPLSTPSKS